MSTLSVLLADPERIDSIPLADIPGLIGAAEALKAALWAKLQAGVAPVVPPGGDGVPGGSGAPSTRQDRLLDVKEAADRLGVKPRWLYRHAKHLPFARWLTGGTLRFSERAMDRWQSTKGNGGTSATVAPVRTKGR